MYLSVFVSVSVICMLYDVSVVCLCTSVVAHKFGWLELAEEDKVKHPSSSKKPARDWDKLEAEVLKEVGS